MDNAGGYARIDPIGKLDTSFGGADGADSARISSAMDDVTLPATTNAFTSSDEANNQSLLVHVTRTEASNSLPQAATTSEDAAAADNLRVVIGPPDEDGSGYAKVNVKGGEDLPPPGQVIEGGEVTDNSNLIGEPILDEFGPRGIDGSEHQSGQIRPENIAPHYEQSSGNMGGVWGFEGPPTLDSQHNVYDQPPVEHEYEKIGWYWNRGPEDFHGPVWKPRTDAIPTPPRDLGLERSILAGKVPDGVATTDLADGWRHMEELYRQQAADLVARGRGDEAANVEALANVYGDMASKLDSGDFSLDELRKTADLWVENSLASPDNAMGAQAIAGMVGEYQKVITDAAGWRADPDWLAAVAKLDAAETSGSASEIMAGQRGIADVFDQKFPPPSWIDGQRPVGDDVYATPYAEHRVSARNRWQQRKNPTGVEAQDYDPSRMPPIETVGFYDDPGMGNTLVIESEEAFELIQQGLVKVELEGEWTDADGNRIFKMTQDADNPLSVGDGAYTIVLNQAVVPPEIDVAAFMETWHADRAARVQNVGDFLEEAASGGNEMEDVASLLDNIPVAHGSPLGSGDRGFAPVTYGLAEQSDGLAAVPNGLETDNAEELGKFYSSGAGRGSSAIDANDVNVPMFDDVIYMTARVDVESADPPGTTTVDDVASAGEIDGAGGNLPPPVPEQPPDLLFANPYADPDNVDMNSIMDTETTAQRTIAAQDPDVGKAMVVDPDYESLPSFVSGSSQTGGGGTPSGGGPTTIGGGHPDPIYDSMADILAGSGGAGGSVPTTAAAKRLPEHLNTVPSTGVPLAPEPQLLDRNFLEWFHSLLQVGRVVDELADLHEQDDLERAGQPGGGDTGSVRA